MYRRIENRKTNKNLSTFTFDEIFYYLSLSYLKS